MVYGMKMKGTKRKLAAVTMAVAMTLGMASSGMRAFDELPNRLSLTAGSNAVLNFALPVSARLDAGGTQATLVENGGGVEISAGEESGSAKLVLRLLGLVPVKEVDVEVSSERRLIPGGKSVGIAIETDGLVVVGASDLGRTASPARLAGLRAGDVITHVNGEAVRTSEELAECLKAGETAEMTILRDGEEKNVSLTPTADSRDGQARIGAWVRSGTAGVGTLTFVDPESGEFGALGHAISDVDTGITLPVAEGGLYESRIVQINRGEKGAPGEIVGDFFDEEQEIGEVTRNGENGVYGTNYSGDTDELLYADGLPVGNRSEMHTGSAQILTTLDDEVQSFDCEIEHVDFGSTDGLRSIVVHITDPDLIERTGGIVQGMSGSPIIQDGKLVGAVTHVFVNDPTRGYGIFIENMLEAAG